MSGMIEMSEMSEVSEIRIIPISKEYRENYDKIGWVVDRVEPVQRVTEPYVTANYGGRAFLNTPWPIGVVVEAFR